MKRRAFITLLGGAAAWPLAARAQQPKVVRLGYLEPQTPKDLVAANLRRQFLLGLRDVGYVEGRHFKMEDRSADGRLDRLPALAIELARLPVDMFVVGGDAPIRAAMQASDKIPIVMTLAADPIGSGFVASLARPGSNVTGMSAVAPDLASKRVELLKEVVPTAARAAVLWNSNNQSEVAEWKDTQDAARTVGLALRSFEARWPEELDDALAAIRINLPDALIAFADGFTIAHRRRIGSFALANRLPMISELREFAEAGGVATYGANRADLWRRSASYVDKIVRGAIPGDLPVEQPTRFEMVINLNTAKAIGLEIAPTVLARADEPPCGIDVPNWCFGESPGTGAIHERDYDDRTGSSQACFSSSRRQVEAKRSGSFEIDDQLIFGGLLHRQVGRFRALENFVHVGSGALMQVVEVRAVAHETAGLHILLGPEHSRQPVLQRKFGQGHALGDGERRRHDEKTTGTLPRHRCEPPSNSSTVRADTMSSWSILKAFRVSLRCQTTRALALQ
jgi:putative tryptophan/tyrosine transport system substrate-binding protein